MQHLVLVSISVMEDLGLVQVVTAQVQLLGIILHTLVYVIIETLLLE